LGRITLVTGTDTGVGKTLLTACLCHHLRNNGVHALAAKPFCTGSRSDARVLRSAGGNELTLEEVNPFYFKQPLAPYVAAKQPVTLDQCLQVIHDLSNRCEHLLVEGAGGVLTPLGKTFFITDLPGESILVSRNGLGTINHTLLSVKAHKPVAVALMNQKRPDLSSKTNAEAIRELLPDIPIVAIPYLGPTAERRITALTQKLSPLHSALCTLHSALKRKPRRNAVW
jgi:dethiobiotin synthetase